MKSIKKLSNKEMRECADMIAAGVVYALPAYHRKNKSVRCTRIVPPRPGTVVGGFGYFNGTFTLPYWLRDYSKKYFIYYVVHEAIHAICKQSHGPMFKHLERVALRHYGLKIWKYDNRHAVHPGVYPWRFNRGLAIYGKR